MAGHNHHRAGQVTAFRPLTQQGDAINIIHPDIEKNQVRTTFASRMARSFPTFRNTDFETLVFKDLLDQIADVRFIIYHQNVSGGHVGTCNSLGSGGLYTTFMVELSTLR